MTIVAFLAAPSASQLVSSQRGSAPAHGIQDQIELIIKAQRGGAIVPFVFTVLVL
jgi:Tfp pilus assembly protein FimT